MITARFRVIGKREYYQSSHGGCGRILGKRVVAVSFLQVDGTGTSWPWWGGPLEVVCWPDEAAQYELGSVVELRVEPLFASTGERIA